MHADVAPLAEHDLVRVNEIAVEASLAGVLDLLEAIVLVASPVTRLERELQTSLQLLPRNSLEVVVVEPELLCSLSQPKLWVNQCVLEAIDLGLERV